MLAIDNTNIIDLGRGNGLPGFAPKVAYAYDATAKTVTVTDTTTYQSGDSKKKLIVRVHDKFGKKVEGTDAAAVSTAALNASKPFDVTITLITTKDLVTDGGAYDIQAAGEASKWDRQYR
ncbi:hypothetical protein ACLOAU_14660 [Niabella sp. CJ426]|uniref:hypothetical protein n=1 Tax=Niabella sp. CJ426 TaxID=3393740 RepID=UPI003CFC0794